MLVHVEQLEPELTEDVLLLQELLDLESSDRERDLLLPEPTRRDRLLSEELRPSRLSDVDSTSLDSLTREGLLLTRDA